VFGSRQQHQHCERCPRTLDVQGRLTFKVKQKVGSMVDEVFSGAANKRQAVGPHDRDAS
jgi:hypothetical protein